MKKQRKPAPPVGLAAALKRPLVFVHGKGGVGKTTVSRAIAQACQEDDKRVLWIRIGAPELQPRPVKSSLGFWQLNCDVDSSFDEYADLKLGSWGATLFAKNRIIRSMVHAAPGIPELLTAGKIWYELKQFDQIIVDLPSTGYAVALFRAVTNFGELFRSGPVAADAREMHSTFADPDRTAHLIVALPEEMPVIESLELRELLEQIFPENDPIFAVNRLFPPVGRSDRAVPDELILEQALDYGRARNRLETACLSKWDDAGIEYCRLPWLAPGNDLDQRLAKHILQELQ